MWYRLPLFAFTLAVAPALASGFYFGENGAKALVQGGAFTAQADDLTAISHNPAGLAQLDGIGFLADLEVLNNQVTFWRQDANFDPANPSKLTAPVSNIGGPFLIPFLAGSYGFSLGSRTLTLGLGIHAPPSVGRLAYAEPNYAKDDTGKYLENPKKYAPNRYALINNDIVVAYPTLTAAIDVHPRLLVGASLQLVLTKFLFRQALFTGDTVGLNPQRIVDEDPEWDATAKVDVTGRVGVTAIFGVLAKPTDWLALGASFRPRIPVHASGDLSIALGENATKAGAGITGNTADLDFTLPMEIRAGVRITPTSRLGLNADFVYQGWDSVDALVLTPREVFMTLPGSEPSAVTPLQIPKHWKATFSGRLGGSYDVMKYLTVHAGVWYETSASPDEYFNLDFAHPDRLFLTAGVSGHLGGLELIAGLAFTPTTTKNVETSSVLRGQTDPTLAPGSIGTGVYTTGGYIATVGLRGHFGKPREAAPAPPPGPAGGLAP